MFGRWLRVVCLATAAWALLFAPGAAGAAGTDRTPDEIHAERVAAAILAPTFESDSVARSSRTGQQTGAEQLAASATAVGHLTSVQVEVGTGPASRPTPPSPALPAQRGAPTAVSLRAPPTI